MDKPTHPENDDSLDDLDLMDDSVEDEIWSEDEDWLDEGDNAFPDDSTDSEDENNLKPAKKRKSSATSILILTVLITGGLGGGAYFYTLNNEQPMDVSYPPIVQNVMPEDDENDNTLDLPETESITAQPVDDINPAIPAPFGVPANDTTDMVADDTNTQNLPAIDDDPDVLTPMPDAAAIENTALAQLEPPALVEEPVSPFEDGAPSVSEGIIPTPDEPVIEIDAAETLNENTDAQDLSSEDIVSLEEDIMLEKTEIEHSALPMGSDDETIAIEDTANKVDVVDGAPVKTEASPQSASDIAVKSKKTEEKIAPTATEPTPVKEPVKKEEMPKPAETKVSSKKVIESAPEKTKKTVRKYAAKDWVLRSAQNGKAVLYNKRSGETKAVETGYSVSGIGRITSISKINGKWVVKGSSGTISQ